MQQWVLQPQSDGSIVIENPSTGKVLDVGGGSRDNGATVWLWTLTGGSNLTVFRSESLATLMNSETFTYTDTADSNFNAEAPDIAVVTDPRDGVQKLAIYITQALPYPGSIKVVMTADPAQGFEDMGFLANVSGYDAHYMAHPNGKQYVFYSNFQSILIIRMADPWTTSGGPATIATATLPWETRQSALNEAPATVVSGGLLNLVYCPTPTTTRITSAA